MIAKERTGRLPSYTVAKKMKSCPRLPYGITLLPLRNTHTRLKVAEIKVGPIHVEKDCRKRKKGRWKRVVGKVDPVLCHIGLQNVIACTNLLQLWASGGEPEGGRLILCFPL